MRNLLSKLFTLAVLCGALSVAVADSRASSARALACCSSCVPSYQNCLSRCATYLCRQVCEDRLSYCEDNCNPGC